VSSLRSIDIKNTSNQTFNGWTLQFVWAQGQTLRTDTGINITKSGNIVTGTDVGVNAVIPPGATVHTSFTANTDGVANSRPFLFALNNRRCTTPQQRNQ